MDRPLISKQDCIWGVKCIEQEAIVSVSSHRSEEYIYIRLDGWRTALELPLAASVAIAWATFSNCEITDDSLLLTRVFSSTPSQLMRALKSDTSYWKLDPAEKAFVTRLGWK